MYLYKITSVIIVCTMISVPVLAEPTQAIWADEISIEQYHPLSEFMNEESIEELFEGEHKPQYYDGQILEQYRHINHMTFGFYAGYCTSYAASQRPDLFDESKYGRMRGNARHRLHRAQSLGMSTGISPQVGAIAVYAPGKGISIYGHVAYVQEVLDDGLIIVRDMNYIGRYVVTIRVVSASAAQGYIYN